MSSELYKLKGGIASDSFKRNKEEEEDDLQFAPQPLGCTRHYEATVFSSRHNHNLFGREAKRRWK